jgi:hypothetical protein
MAVNGSKRFGLGRVTDLDRKLAETEIEHARSLGRIDGEEAARRLAKVRTATTHAALRVAVAGRADAVVPPILVAAPGVIGRLWLLVSVVNFVVWLLIGVIGGGWDPVWLISVVFGGGVLYAGVWGARNWDQRMRASGDTPY